MNTRVLPLTLAALLLGACGAPTAPTPGEVSTLPPTTPPADPPTTPPVTPTTATLRVVVPHAATQAAATLTLSLRTGDTSVLAKTFSVTSAAAECTPDPQNTTLTCTYALTVDPGTFTADLAASNAAGDVLSRATTTVTFAARQDTSVNLTLSGVPASALLALTDREDDLGPGNGPDALDLDLGGAYAARVSLLDADGFLILDPDVTATGLCTTSEGFGVAPADGAASFTLTTPTPDLTARAATFTVPRAGHDCTDDTPLPVATTLRVTPLRLGLTVTPATVTVGERYTATAQYLSTRGRNVAVSGKIVSLSFGGAFGRTDTNGAFSGNTAAPTTPGSVNVSASSQGLTAGATVTVVAGPAANLSATLDPSTVYLDEKSTLTTSVTDRYGNAVSDAVTVTPATGMIVTRTGESGGVGTFEVDPNLRAGQRYVFVQSGLLQTAAVLNVRRYPLTITQGGADLTRHDFTSSEPQSFLLAEKLYTGGFSFVNSGDPNVAVAVIDGSTLTVTPVNAGETTLTIKDAYNQWHTLTVSVTGLAVTVR
ncbi:hypothetical protein [Deinococcus pimensis]|uniref:hypothetical protein n=1 Tax=Deinococcus pimensis TaxID=309888 RepID=UPI000484B904|nr:hypothetical protein [Deinococcus pimensis]